MARALQTTSVDNLLQQVLSQLETTLDATSAFVQELVRNRDVATLSRGEQFRAVPDAGFLAKGSTLEPGQDEPALMELAEKQGLEIPMERLISLRNKRYEESNPRYWGIVNFDLHSSKPRLFVFDVVARETSSYLCAHGRGSEGPEDDGLADVFSNVEESRATSLGIYRCAETYQGENGYSLRMDGLEETNSRARSRAIVVHGADYVSARFSQRYGRIGRSEGCPALDHLVAQTVINQLKQGSLLMHWKTP
ncbi:murein L,D-transpeptidase catalytic domain family protein [Rhizobium leguminosarum]|uniref:L, D-transpeptidase catalytic domain family protein n=1 Tax=Rhizobium leguminosarum TaxID=384 RepID=A0A2Z4YVY8_RHILE|nr:murein L,D-transpeptidase catalytic domain family protein [Rhizobium leguminosarum]AXA44622.1 L, D-transpeptidase catalytic domain family protein [Rhizobium leguminosarum]